MNKSIWSSYINKNCEESLKNNINVDILIIGGGITGMNVAYHLINKNLKIALVEKNKLFCGITSKTTGKITYLQEDIYSKLKVYFNENISKMYFESQKKAIELLVNTIKTNEIKCDLEKVKSYIFANKKEKTIQKEINILKSFGAKINSTYKLPENIICSSAAYIDNTYVFNPIKYLNSLKNICTSNGLKIYENTKIIKITKNENMYKSFTNNNVITSKYVVLALHFPYFLFPFLTPLKVTSKKSYIRAFINDKNYKYSAINVEKPTKSIRFYNNGEKIYKIELSNSHNIAIKNNEKVNFNQFDYDKKDYDYIWSNIDIITNDRLPFIGKIDDNLFIGTGYNAWGMTNSFLAGKIISDIILKKPNPYISLFNPKRIINLGKIINFPISLCSNIYSFTKSKIVINKKWYKNIKIAKYKNKNIGIYTDLSNKKHIVYTSCPHLKCNLIFNEVELTWDCPCHGSRFDIDGKCLEGPSNDDIAVKR